MSTITKIFAPFAVVGSLAACGAAPSGTYSEDANYNGQRTTIQNQPMHCEVYSSESGVVQGGTYIFNGGSAVRNCVSTSNAQAISDGISDVTNIIYQVQGLGYALGLN